MFKNVGKVMKGLAKVLFVIYLLLGIAFGVVVLVVGSEAARYGNVDMWQFILAFIGILILTFIIAYVSVMMLYAFGSIVDDLKTIKEQMYTITSPKYGDAPSGATGYNPPADYGSGYGNGYGNDGGYNSADYADYGNQNGYDQPSSYNNPPSYGDDNNSTGGSGLKMNF